MARRHRLQFRGALYHVISRGNRRLAIFDDASDRGLFMTTFSELARSYGVRVYAATLMSTHYHLLVDTPRNNLSDFMRQLNSLYSQDHNRRHQRVGHTFEQRFTSIVVQREKYLRRVARYIVLNPVKAGLCRDPSEWKWTTYRATAGLEVQPSWLHCDWLPWAFHTSSLTAARGRYQIYVADPGALAWTFDERQSALGTDRFKKAVVRLAVAHEPDRPLPVDCVPFTRERLAALFAELEPCMQSRDALIWAAHVTHGYRLAEIASFLGIDASTASKAVRRVRRARRMLGSPPAR